jgi:N-acetylornithine carbamoyltransferase
MRRFNDLADFSREEIQDLIALAARLDKHPEPRALEGKVLSLLFLSPSLRTLSSFQAAMIRLGGGAFVISPEMSIHGLESRYGIVMDGQAAEHVREAIPVIASYGDAMGVRAFAERRDLAHDVADKDFQALTSLIDKPWINMESAIDHPCQSLADWKTMDELALPANGKFVLSWGYHPRPLPLAVSAATIHMAAKRGMNVVIFARRLRAAARDHGAGAQGRGGVRGQRARDDRPARSDGRGARDLREVVFVHAPLRRQARRSGAARGARRHLVRRRAVVLQRAARLQVHALLAGAPRRRGRGPHLGRPAQHRDPGGAQPHGGADGRRLSNDEERMMKGER